PLHLAKAAKDAGSESTAAYVVDQLKSGKLRFAAEHPDSPQNFPRNLFIWRSNLLGSSGKGHDYLLKYLLGANHGVQGKDLGKMDGVKPQEVDWHEEAAEGKVDLLVTQTSACPPPASTRISCCPRPPGTRRTTSTPPTCTPSSIR